MGTKRIGIITLHGYYNYGNRLQNYALLYILKKMGYSVNSVIVKPQRKRGKLLKSAFGTILTESPKGIFLKLKKMFQSKNEAEPINDIDKKIISERTEHFKSFSDKFLNEIFVNTSNNKDMNLLNSFSFFITGSDQVWNPMYYLNLDTYFLTFSESKKRIAYAPSMSVDRIPNKYKKDYKKWLTEMKAISIREEAGAKIINELTGINVPVLVDPTLLLNKNEWLTVSKRAKNRPDEKYILTYFLGDIPLETQKYIEELSQKNKMSVINLGTIYEPESYKTGPSEFIDYIDNASVMLTDSFHGGVFSIVLETPFVIFERQSQVASMYSRIETLLQTFNFRDREFKNINENVFEIDFTHTKQILENEYEKSINYLKESLR